MCCCRVRLMSPIIAASVVVLPEPVAPVTRTRPRCSSASRATPGRSRDRRTSARASGSRGRRTRWSRAGGSRSRGSAAGRRPVGDVEVAGLVEHSRRAGVSTDTVASDALEVGSRAAASRPWARRRRRGGASAGARPSDGRRSRPLDGAQEEGVEVHAPSYSARAEARLSRARMAVLPGVCPSGQRERSVKPPAQPTKVRILPPSIASPALSFRVSRSLDTASLSS